MKILLSPHNDDAELFVAFTIMREKPHVIIITDSYIQFNRGQGITADQRWNETCAAADLLQYPVMRLGMRDDTPDENKLYELLLPFKDVEAVYAPALQGGNIMHDMTSRVADFIWGDKVIFYTTYTKDELYTKGSVEVVPTPEEIQLKHRALECHASQMEVNMPHFDAVFGKSEWLIK